jgi:hypothetical protein
MQAMRACSDLGAVSVAMVSPALGKTTAAKVFLRRNKDAVRGIAFCRDGRKGKGMSYVSEMLRLLGMSTTNPPRGWLSCLVDALQFPSPGDDRRSYLILDEFGSEPGDQVDNILVEELKSLLRNTEIRAILLTPSEPYANYLLTRNNLQGIVPLSGTFPVGTYLGTPWGSGRACTGQSTRSKLQLGTTLASKSSPLIKLIAQWTTTWRGSPIMSLSLILSLSPILSLAR